MRRENALLWQKWDSNGHSLVVTWQTQTDRDEQDTMSQNTLCRLTDLTHFYNPNSSVSADTCHTPAWPERPSALGPALHKNMLCSWHQIPWPFPRLWEIKPDLWHKLLIFKWNWFSFIFIYIYIYCWEILYFNVNYHIHNINVFLSGISGFRFKFLYTMWNISYNQLWKIWKSILKIYQKSNKKLIKCE